MSMVGNIVITPEPFDGQMLLCGAVTTWTIENSLEEAGSLLASTVTNAPRYLTNDSAAGAGWGEMQTLGLDNAGLPIIGAAFAKAINPNIGAGISGNFGLMWPHRYTRPGL